MNAEMNQEELGREMLRLMVADGVALTDDINQCESAILSWVRKSGAAALQAQLGGGKAGLRRDVPGVCLPGESEVCRSPRANPGHAAGPGHAGAGLLPLS